MNNRLSTFCLEIFTCWFRDKLRLIKLNSVDAMIPRANKILMEAIGAEDGRGVKTGDLYSDNIYAKDALLRRVIASIYTDGNRATGVRLKAESYEEMDCPTRCYTYKMQELRFRHYDLPIDRTAIYSSFFIERRIPRKTVELSIEGELISAARLSIERHLGSRHRAGEHSTDYMSIRNFHMLL
jgi:hypothetical protein